MSLKRTRVGDFVIDDTLTLNQISALVLKGEIEDYIVSIDEMFSDYRKLTVDAVYNRLLYNGNKLPLEAIVSDGGEFLDMEKFRIYDAEGSFVGIYKYIGGQFVLEKCFMIIQIPERWCRPGWNTYMGLKISSLKAQVQ